MTPWIVSHARFSRRTFAGFAGLLVGGCRSATPRKISAPIFIADAHNHYGIFAPSKIRGGEDLGPRLRAAGATLIAWTPTSDGPWIRRGTNRMEQFAEPQKGQLEANFFNGLSRAKRYAERTNLPIVLVPTDVDRAAKGESMLVLAAEAADFLEGSLANLRRVHEMGLRHLQLVHYLRNPIGDIQTERPVHNGLSAFGKEVVAACNREGILIDLAHSTRENIDMALDITTTAPIWSHSVITTENEHWSQSGALARRLNVTHARKIASRGGAIGIWALGGSTGYRITNYVDSLLRAADLVGPEHVMIGSDTDGFGANERPSIEEPADLRRVVDELLSRDVSEAVVRGICFGNYARCLRAAMARRTVPAG